MIRKNGVTESDLARMHKAQELIFDAMEQLRLVNKGSCGLVRTELRPLYESLVTMEWRADGGEAF